MLLRVVAALSILVAAVQAAAQTTVTLRSALHVAEDAQELRVSDVAEVVGPDAAALGEAVVCRGLKPAPDGTLTIGMAAVRAALETVPPPGVNWGKTTLGGSVCVVRIGDGVPTPRAVGQVKGSIFKPVAVETSGPPNVRIAIAVRLAALNGVDIDHLRLGFDPAEEELLSSPTEGRTVEISPSAGAGSARVPVLVNLYSGDRLAVSRTLMVEQHVNRAVLTAAGPVERGRTLTAADVTATEQWTSPRAGRALALEDAVGSITQRRIGAGEVIDPDDLTPPLACKKGDIVYVHCVSGGIIVKAKARSMGAARDGEMVSLLVEGADGPVSARMSGPGRAVLVLAAAGPGEAPQVYRGNPAVPKRKFPAKKVLTQ